MASRVDVTSALAAADAMQERAERRRQKVAEAINRTARYVATQCENTMKLEAPWTDRTGNARNGLFSVVTHEVDPHKQEGSQYVELTLGHSVPYGIYLEVCNHKRYAIVIPTLRTGGQQLTRMLRQVLR